MAYARVGMVILVALGLLASCGGGGGGSVGEGGAGQGMVLLGFLQQDLDNIQLNSPLEFQFSDVVDASTISPQTLQIRKGPSFGLTVPGSFSVQGSTVIFEPRLPSLCDLSDSGFEPSTTYRVQLLGSPEEFAIRNPAGQSLASTRTFSFRTRIETDPDLFADQVPAAGPAVTTASPQNGDEAVAVEPGNRIVLTLTENLSPCTVNDTNVRVFMYQFGHAPTMVPAASGNMSGFATAGGDTSDQTPNDPYTWGTVGTMPDVTTLPTPQRVLTHLQLDQSLTETRLTITPTFGFNPNPALNASLFPENALVVVELTFGVEDFGGTPMQPFVMAFTTENLPASPGTYVVANQGETPWDEGLSTARFLPEGSGRVQGFMLFSGDGDNGADHNRPSLPQSDPGTCLTDYQSNDGTPDDFDPGGDVLLDTGATPNECPNGTDGSFGVVWEFNTFRIRSGITVRLVGVNPAIILVQGDATIEAGARLLARGDNQNGSPRGAGEGNKNATTEAGTSGGTGVAGGGDGGDGPANSSSSRRVGGDGLQGYYHGSPQGPLATDVGDEGGTGSGLGNTSALWTAQTNPNNRNTPSGGGGGHAEPGEDGEANGTGTAPTTVDLPLEGEGGQTYGDNSGQMLTPEAGSGGGAGGELRPFTSNVGRGPGGAGGAGGGFVDLTSGGDIIVNGTIDAAGSIGGSNPGGNFSPNYSWNPGTGGGGGGSGGGIRLLTPNDIILGGTSVLTAAGGAGGAGGLSQGTTGPAANDGGAGGAGRICLEDGNSVITGLATAGVTPSEGSAGFYRGVFNPNRFQGGGLTPQATSEVFAVGPMDPTFLNPQQIYPSGADFVVGVLNAASNGAGTTAMLVEARGYEILPDGEPDLAGTIAAPTPWHTVGYFTDSTVDNQPTWMLGQPPLGEIGGALPGGNTGTFGITNLDGREYIQLRVTFYLSSAIGPSDPGHYLDDWIIRFTSDR